MAGWARVARSRKRSVIKPLAFGPDQDRSSGDPKPERTVNPEVDRLVAEDSHLVLLRRFTRGLTGDRESIVLELEGPARLALLEQAAEAARGYGSQYLTIELPDEAPWLPAGFELESYRISLTTSVCRPPQDSPYTVRAPGPGDDFAIVLLNSMLLPHTLCGSRRYDISELTFRSMGATQAQVSSQDPGAQTLVLALAHELVGYLMLQDSYIYDLGVEPKHWGGMAVRHIMRAGSTALYQRGIPEMVGDVSAANPRALKFATRALGFRILSRRYGLTL